MHFFEFAQKDSTLYEGQATQSVNTGLDEILEIRKDMDDSGQTINVSRVVIQFDIANISSSVVNGTIPADANYFLNLFDAASTELITSQSLYAYPISQSWVPGEGFFSDNPITTEGSSWRYRDGEITGTQWVSGSNSAGGRWVSGSTYEASQSFDHETSDMRMNVTDIVKHWLSGSHDGVVLHNNGFIVKRSGSIGNSDTNVEEGNTDRFGQFKFFSRDTHTIFPPKLEVEWDDHSWSTGSLEPLTGSALEDTVIYFKNLREEYKQNSKVRFRLVGRERYPKKTYSTTAAEVAVKYLPSGSQFIEHGTYYQVRDAVTDDVIIPYGTGSIVSCDTESNFFNIWMNGFQPERYYKFEIRVVTGSKSSQTQIVNEYDNEYVFKVSR